ncbi:MAG TPA: glycine zipper 2TM domain-containing protein [Sphingopyxis sp.]|nr:glycine zipper 2TM domain-containing protein [Sphingopyxis sp.]HMP45533.1 glycine zipper 2TM domain-containing protein [Sphingopyxis sp.]HMQ18876.1 glycine zipper 2TM domain-containing protein [Sphingopyxis sp.]
MKKYLILPLAAATALAGGCASTGGYDDGGYGYYDRTHYDRYGRYDWDRPDPRYGGYYADQYHRSDRRYRERRLGNNDRIYRGRDGQYYCRRSDGSTGLIVGGIAGGVLGNIIAPGDSKTLGTVLGAVGGAVAGRAIDRSGNDDVRCR